MQFYDRYLSLCSEKGLKPQSPDILSIAGVSSASVTGWKQGSLPRAEVLVRLSEHFCVTVDYLLGLSDLRESTPLTADESILLAAFRACSTEGRFKIIQVCMNEKEKVNTAVS